MDSGTEYTLETVISNMRWFIEHYGTPTRDKFRESEGKGALPERVWRRFFPSFSEFRKAASVDQTGQMASGEKFEYADDKLNISIDQTDIHTLEELVDYAKIDLTIWHVKRFQANKWDAPVKDGKQVMWQVKAELVPKQNIIDAKQEIEDLKNLAKESAHWPTPVTRKASLTGNSLELLVPDLHAGKFSWRKETGHPDYDTPTAISTYEAAIDDLLDLSGGFLFDEIVLGVGNDVLNSDDYNSQTTKGTLVSSDTRYQKTYKAVREMLVRTIEKLRPYCRKVVVKIVPGNHDAQSCFTLGDSLECYFHNYTDVEIDNAPTPHKFYRWGNVFLGFTHGDHGKKSDYGLWMATEKPVDFGESKYREIHIGHTHGLKVDEKFGVRVRTFAALCPPDAWHSQNMFVGNLRQAEAIVWNKEKGRVAEFIHTATD